MSNDTLLAAIDAEIRGLEEAPKAAGRRRGIWNEGGPGEEGGPEAAPAGRGGSGADCRGATQPRRPGRRRGTARRNQRAGIREEHIPGR
jgi:hypothetical protein